ncbi:hypothetical protein [Cellulomonas biazotea]|uniref:Uncharacterized protein n=1 Tax=Cellulomonas biazotea TaxID=1709 RepID=A0A402DTV5_9CELL|nr:hypothetical protein [Cellulomonas biazotea]GCE77532.1 hypothetical protein CBZ_25880 [Cellulomonas biazotea]
MRPSAVLPTLALAAASTLAVTIAVTLVATPAHAGPPPTCGSTLTVDTRLRADLTCPADGLRLAPGVTLDLGGHTLRGPGTGVGVAVSNEGTVTVRNGTLADWGHAVQTIFPADEESVSGPLVVRRVTVQDNAVGVSASGEDTTGRWRKPTTVDRSTFLRNDIGLLVAWFGSAEVDRSTFTDNRVGLFNDAGDATVTDSRFLRNERGYVATEASGHIEGSTFADNATAVRQNNVGSVTIVDSRFTGSVTAVDAIGWEAAVSGSTFVSNTTAVAVGEYGGAVIGSTFRQNGTTVRVPDMLSGPALVQDNTFLRNADGLDSTLGDPYLEVGGNVARGNTGWGLHVPGATDLGGNTARNNGNEPQCVGVVCATS